MFHVRNRIRSIMLVVAVAGLGCDSITDPPRTGIRLISSPGLRDTAMARPAEPFVVEVRDSKGGFSTPSLISVTSGPAPGSTEPFPSAVNIAESPTDDGAFFALIPLGTDGRARFWVRRGPKAGAATITVGGFDVESVITLTTDPGRAAAFNAEPADTAVYVGRSYRVRAAVTDQWGNERPDPVQFTTSTGLTVSSDGTVTPREIGRRAVRLASGSLTGQAWVSVPPVGTIAAISGPSYSESIVVLNLDGSEWRTIGPPLSTYSQRTAPQWAPTGDELVFHNVADGIVSYRTDLGGNARRLFAAGAPPAQIYPRYSRDGEWLFFSGGSDVRSVAIWRARPDGSAAEQLGPPVWEPDYQADPSPSPDGTRVAYLQQAIVGTMTLPVLRVLNVATGQVTPLDIPARSARWSPTSDHIAFIDLNEQVILIDPVGSNRRVLSTPGRRYSAGLDWSPDGQWVIARSAEKPILELINAQTAETLPLTFSKILEEPAWRPNAQ